MLDNMLKSQAFKLKGRLYTLTVLQVLETNGILFATQLHEAVAQAPRFFEATPVVLDFSELDDASLAVNSFNLQELCECVRSCGMLPIAIQGGNLIINELAHSQGFAVLNGSSTQDKSCTPVNTATEKSEARSMTTKFITTPVRSGQQVVSSGGSLVVTAPVSHGAELLADGSIHVYGALRGRALAGIAGEKNARIFCQSLDAELLSIAGVYRLSDAIEPINAPCQIFIQDDRLQIELL